MKKSNMFYTIGIITKPNDPHSNDKAKELGTLLKGKGIDVVQGDKQIAAQADLIIVVGGDGSLLNTARTFVDNKIPILGINLGRLGFLADVPATNMADIVTEILNGDFTQEERHLLSCEIKQDGKILGHFLALFTFLTSPLVSSNFSFGYCPVCPLLIYGFLLLLLYL
jgi:NAD+ kinase